MKIETLHLFAIVMRTGGFTAAARRANTDPSAVSRAVAALEREIGVRLFDRSTRKFRPTEAGRAYCAALEPLLEELDRAAAHARDLASRPVGHLRIGASVAFGCDVLAPRLAAFRAACPEVTVELVLDDQAVDLGIERIDVAIRLGPSPGDDYEREYLMPVKHRVCASPGWLARTARPTAPAELAAHACVLFPLGGFAERWRFRRDADSEVIEVPVHGALTISSALALKRCVLDGLGPGLLADWMIADELASGALIDLMPEFEVTATRFDTAAWLVYPSTSYVPLKVQAFVAFLRAQLGTA